MDTLILQLRIESLGYGLFNEFYGCPLYADDIILMTHRPMVQAMQMMLRLCDMFADDFDIRFTCGKSVAQMRS